VGAGEQPSSAVPPDLPPSLASLEDWLAEREAAVPGIVPGTEKHIDWYDGRYERRPLAVVYLHGFSATRQETHPLARDVASALGAHAFHTRLTGHGLDGEALADATVAQWLADGREALAVADRLGERVVIIACSTGGTLATALMMEDAAAARTVHSLVLVSPNFGLANRSASIMNFPLGLTVARLIAGSERSFEAISELHARFWTTRYPIEAVATMMQLLRRVKRGDPERVSMPVLTLYAPGDRVLSVPAILRMHARFPHPDNALLAVEDSVDLSQHVIAGDILSPGTTSRLVSDIVRFVGRESATPGTAGTGPGPAER
jgi:alpha-beta hydrolase superfamily lysophospholipase